VTRLTQQVADLKAERQNFEEEIRRLHRVVQEAMVAISDLKAAQFAKPARNTAAGTRPISIHDLRVRRLGRSAPASCAVDESDRMSHRASRSSTV